MVHHAMRKLYGDNCYFADNSWKRYQRMNTGDTLIFNFGNTCCGGGYSYGGCCGGGSFWGGFGAGIGMGLANLFSGFMGGFMSMPFMNMWGGGMFGGGLWGSSLWGGSQSVSPWGGGGAYTPSTKTDKKTTPTTDKDVNPLGAGNTYTHNCVDEDAANVNRLRKAFRDEIIKLSPDVTTLQDLYDEIVQLTTTPKDALNEDDNKQAYKDLLDEFGQYYNIANGKIGEKKVPPDVKESDFEGMKLNGVAPSELVALGIRPVILPNNVKGLKLPTDFGTMDDKQAAKVMDIISKTKLWVGFDYCKTSSDPWVIGKVTNVNKTADNKLLSYDIDCSENYPPGDDYEPINKDTYTVTKMSVSKDWTKVTAKSKNNPNEIRELKYNPALEVYEGTESFPAK